MPEIATIEAIAKKAGMAEPHALVLQLVGQLLTTVPMEVLQEASDEMKEDPQWELIDGFRYLRRVLQDSALTG